VERSGREQSLYVLKRMAVANEGTAEEGLVGAKFLEAEGFKISWSPISRRDVSRDGGKQWNVERSEGSID
jgi:hypothetical protein